MALFRSTPATVESTPPLSPRMTLSSPSWLRSSSTVVSMNEAGVHSPLHPQMSNAKLDRIFVPSTLWNTSGWNWTAYTALSLNWNAAFTTSSVEAITSALPGMAEIVSPWDIHTWECASTPFRRGESAFTTFSIARPYSLASEPSTLPPHLEAMYCAP